MDPNVSQKMTPVYRRQFPHPSPLPPPRKPVSDTLLSINPNEGKQDPINRVFLTLLTQIFAKKYALNLESSNLLDSPLSTETRAELDQMLADLKRVQKWTETTIRQAEKTLQESAKAPPLPPTPSSTPAIKPHSFKQFFVAARKWFERVSTN